MAKQRVRFEFLGTALEYYCPACSGEGRVEYGHPPIESECGDCDGQGGYLTTDGEDLLHFMEHYLKAREKKGRR